MLAVFSTSLPEDIQFEALRKVRGFDQVKFFRPGYAIEYDYFPPTQLNHSLQTKLYDNLFFAGQINGTSGYEEAAAQGLIAGINAASKIQKTDPIKLSRSEAYIGVLIDDLINKSTKEPYRMFTSRAEFRLLLRQDNADLRLSAYGTEKGLLTKPETERLMTKKQQIGELKKLVEKRNMEPEVFNTSFDGKSTALKQAERLITLARRPEIDLQDLLDICDLKGFGAEAVQEVAFNIKYEGYIKRNQALIERFYRYENQKIPSTFNYDNIEALSAEGREKLSRIKPDNFGQASRISGVSPADLSVLLIYMEKAKYQKKVSRETSL